VLHSSSLLTRNTRN